MNTKTMENLLAVADKKSVSKAAELLYMSQPTLSRSIRSAEKELGFKLFCYEHRQMNLTDAGIIYINGVKAILAEKQAMEKKLAELKDESRQQVRLLVPPDEYAFVARYILPDFQEAVPHTELLLMENSQELAMEYLMAGLADLVLTTSAAAIQNGLEQQILYDDEIVLALPLSWMPPGTFSLTDLADKCFLLTSLENSWALLESDILRQHGFTPKIVREVSGCPAALRMTVSGCGVSFLPRRLAQMHEGRIAFQSLSPPYRYQRCAAYPKSPRLTKAAKRLVDILASHYPKYDHYLSMLRKEESSWRGPSAPF